MEDLEGIGVEIENMASAVSNNETINLSWMLKYANN